MWSYFKKLPRAKRKCFLGFEGHIQLKILQRIEFNITEVPRPQIPLKILDVNLFCGAQVDEFVISCFSVTSVSLCQFGRPGEHFINYITIGSSASCFRKWQWFDCVLIHLGKLLPKHPSFLLIAGINPFWCKSVIQRAPTNTSSV